MTAQSAVMIQSNNTGEFCVTITVTDDNIIEPDELFSINWNLTENFNGRVNLSNSMTEITITDNGKTKVNAHMQLQMIFESNKIIFELLLYSFSKMFHSEVPLLFYCTKC